MIQARAEFTVEPFTEGAPGPHVDAAISAARTAGFEPDVGPFGTAITGAPADVFAALVTLVESSSQAGATRISIQVTVE